MRCTARRDLSRWLAASLFVLLSMVVVSRAAEPLKVKRIAGAKQRNVIFILVDDHRFDAMSYMGHPFLETPRLDELARGGVHFANGFVTTSL